ncbi:NrfD/PsrC family molybdoenzyme membrane anchor subunit [Adlercreutzia sp. ZJ242]|uniref:NrfD/PsrC family molybdoenzyme membrane anchor subunit n=1 Tax=Adlercreutzia sp. ZJ242 TaxID=2709409 RepID=UPI0013EADB19|nr:NrfD/PsrC family molybdoenzyme membrane anchor subunit [Adlercreutzia sp. ZJ242]
MQTASPKFKIAVGVLGVLAAAGVAAWIYQLMGGLGVTGMSNGTSWGLYITMFMLFVGLSAGGLIVASSASVFHITKFKAVALPAIILSTVCICVAGMFVLIDMGGIQRVWRIITGPNPTSPLFWDMCVITIYLVLNILYLVFMTKHGVDSHKVEVVSRFALPAAILVHSVTAWIFGLQLAKEWYSAIMAPIFVASAMDSGLALLLVVLVALDAAGWFKFSRELMKSLAGLLATCIAIDAFLIGCEVLTMAYPGAAGAEALAIMLGGATAPFFWFEVVGGLLVPFCVLVFAKNRANTKLVVASSVLVVLGVLCKRVWLLLTSFVVPNVYGAPGIASGSSAAAHATGVDTWAATSSYAPTWVELVVVAGVLALGALAFMLLARKMLVEGSGKEKARVASAAGKEAASAAGAEASA